MKQVLARWRKLVCLQVPAHLKNEDDGYMIPLLIARLIMQCKRYSQLSLEKYRCGTFQFCL